MSRIAMFFEMKSLENKAYSWLVNPIYNAKYCNFLSDAEAYHK